MTPSDLPRETIRDISAALTALLADMFALNMKTKNFHWHMSGQLQAWLFSWLLMLPVVLFAAPAIRRLAHAVTTEE